jgi:serine protease Do
MRRQWKERHWGWLGGGVLVAGVVLMAGAGSAGAQDAPAPPARPRSVYVQGEAAMPARVAAPEGWLGIHYVCEIETWAKNGELWVKHSGYPLVAAVEPGSPADRAGIEAGDTIIAYNNEDINGRPFSLTKLLRPGSKLNVRIHRAKGSYDIPVTVMRRTRYAPDVGAIAPRVSVEIDSVTGLAQRMIIRSRGSARLAPTYVVVDPSTSTPAIAPVAPMSAPMLAWSTTTAMAGAELARVTPDLGESFGVGHGVLVLSVGANTPAARAGLRGGDVITRADGVEILTPVQFGRALQRADDDEVKLTVVRKRKSVETVLRW